MPDMIPIGMHFSFGGQQMKRSQLQVIEAFHRPAILPIGGHKLFEMLLPLVHAKWAYTRTKLPPDTFPLPTTGSMERILAPADAHVKSVGRERGQDRRGWTNSPPGG